MNQTLLRLPSPDLPPSAFRSPWRAWTAAAICAATLGAGCASAPPTCTAEDTAAWRAANAKAITAVDYPAVSRRLGHQGRVEIELDVDAADQVTATRIKSSSGHADLDDAALAAVRSGQFRSPVCGGRRVGHSFVLPFDFALDPAPASPPASGQALPPGPGQ